MFVSEPSVDPRPYHETAPRGAHPRNERSAQAPNGTHLTEPTSQSPRIAVVTVTFHNPSTAPAPLADRFSNLAEIDLGPVTMLVLSGQVAIDYDGSFVGADMTTQSEQVFGTIGALLAAHRAGFEHVVNIRTYLTDMELLADYGAVRRRYLTGTPPTSTTIGVSRLFHPEALLEVDITAVVPK
jgi:enamine deaminase RidA (YjgF/YER057c/UK114 family)